jgi:hypothetical protein
VAQRSQRSPHRPPSSERKEQLLEFLNLEPSFPVLDPTKPHRVYWYLKRYGLPFMYWNLMLKGMA